VEGSGALLVVVDDDQPGVVRLVGELDLAGVPEVEARLGSLDGPIVIDCSGLTFIDSCGLGLFVAAHHQSVAGGAKLAIVDPSPCVTRVLELTGLDTVFDVHRNGSAL
jgi:anti-sigma B factor antagonist